MDLPIKILLINQSAYIGVIKLDSIIYADNILLSFELFNFKSKPTSILVESFESYMSNREFLKTLPIEKAFEFQFDLLKAEQYYQYLLSIYDAGSNNLTSIDVSNLRLYLNSIQIFSIICYFQNFIMGYNNLKINIDIFREREIQKKESLPIQYTPDVVSVDKEESKIIIDSEIIIDTDKSFINELLKLSPSNIITYNISKYIQDILSTDEIDIISISKDERKNITVLIQPLINFNYLKLSETSIYNFINLLDSFNFTVPEYINKLKSLMKALIYVINKENINDFNVSIKVIEFLILIYTLKSDPNQISILLNEDQNINNTTIETMVNNTIFYILTKSKEFQYENSYIISFFHPLKSEYIKNEINDHDIKKILNNEIYLMDIDKLQFIQSVFDKTNIKKKGEISLLLGNPIIININESLISNNFGYKLLEVKDKQFSSNKIITPEYYKILKIGTSLFQDIYFEKETELDLIISKYYSGIEMCLKQISNTDVEISLTSTLNLMYQFIKPNIEASTQIELFILYKIVIPFVYDTFKIFVFTDYFI
jgi:hypothetical protein